MSGVDTLVHVQVSACVQAAFQLHRHYKAGKADHLCSTVLGRNVSMSFCENINVSGDFVSSGILKECRTCYIAAEHFGACNHAALGTASQNHAHLLPSDPWLFCPAGFM